MLNCSSLSTNVVATSKASVYTAHLDKILSTPGWSPASTFAQFYNQPVDVANDLAENV